MSREKLDRVTLHAFRGGVTIGLGVLLWLQSNTVSRQEFERYKISHDRERDLILENLNNKFDTINNALKRIDTKLDRLVIYNPPRHEPELKGRL